MKRIITAVIAAALALILSACASDSYLILNYETKERMNDSLTFEMRDVPELENVIVYGAADGQLGEIEYAFIHETKGEGTLTFRMAKADYAERYSAAMQSPGIAGIEASAADYTERLGAATVTYYTAGSTVFAVWTLGDYAYSAAVSYNNKTVVPDRSDVYTFVISVIST